MPVPQNNICYHSLPICFFSESENNSDNRNSEFLLDHEQQPLQRHLDKVVPLNATAQPNHQSENSNNNFNAAPPSAHHPLGDPRPSNILVFPSLLFESHLFIFKILGQALQQYGHRLVLFVSDRRAIEEESPYFSVRKFPGIFSTDEGAAFVQAKVSNILAGRPALIELFDVISQYRKNCDLLFSDKRGAIEQLRRDKYDLIVVDPNEMCGFLLARELNVPFLVFSTGMWVPHETYAPSPVAYVPEFNSQLTDRMNFVQRVKNAFVTSVTRIGTSYVIFPIYNRIIRRYKIGDGAPLEKIVKETKAWLLCTDNALEFPRPMLPNMEYIGGIITKPAKPLPQVAMGGETALLKGFVYFGMALDFTGFKK